MTTPSLSRIPANDLSHVAGSTDEPLLDCTVGAALVETARRWPEREAAVFFDESHATLERWTWAQLRDKVDQLALGLRQLGIGKGDRVGIWSPNRPEWLLTQFATARLGAILVNINPAYRSSELQFALNKIECKLLVCACSHKSSDYLSMLRKIAPEIDHNDPEHLELDALPTLQTIVHMGQRKEAGMLRFVDVVANSTAKHERNDTSILDSIEAELDPHDAINIQFTSGTTGSPKGATLSHHNIVNNAWFVTGTMDFDENDRLCIPVPFYHCFGMVMGTLGCVTRGATMVIPGEGFDAVSTLRAIDQEACTALYSVPTMFTAMLDHADFARHDVSKLRTGIMAGAPCPIEIMRRVQTDMNLTEITIAYGMTETSPVSFQSATDDPIEMRTTSVGRIHPHVECRVIDLDGAVVPVGTQGELCTRGYSVMKGYWGELERTQEVIDTDGWMHTGDLATIDANGYANITGRLKDMIVRGGENVYPKEIEEYLYQLRGVSQVQVFGIPDERLGEIVCAWIVATTGVAAPNESDVQDFCRDNIAHYKVPTIVRIVDEMPMTVTGKAQKFRMRQKMIEELGLVETETA